MGCNAVMNDVIAMPIFELGDASALQPTWEDSTVAAPKYKKSRLSISRIISLCHLNCENPLGELVCDLSVDSDAREAAGIEGGKLLVRFVDDELESV